MFRLATLNAPRPFVPNAQRAAMSPSSGLTATFSRREKASNAAPEEKGFADLRARERAQASISQAK